MNDKERKTTKIDDPEEGEIDGNRQLEKYFAENEGLKSLTPNELMQSFLDQYPEVFGGTNMKAGGGQSYEQQQAVNPYTPPAPPTEQQQWEQKGLWDKIKGIPSEVAKSPINPGVDYGLMAVAPQIEMLRQSWKKRPQSWGNWWR